MDLEVNEMIKRYDSLEGLRALSCISIIAMHILYNTEYQITGFMYEKFIPSLTWLVYLFLMLSGFGMCAGYLQKFRENKIDLEVFYKKRYKKILPFFSFLLLIALVMEPSLSNVYEVSMEITMLHGLLPNNAMNVLGVCWTLGVIFLFYLLFPAFTVLMKNKKRAWCALLISIWIHFICQEYFFGDIYVTKLFTPRHSFIYCIPLFIGGGIVYLYRDEIRIVCEKYRWGVFGGCVIVSCLYYMLPHKVGKIDISYYYLMLCFMLWLSYGVGVDSKILGSRIMKYFSSISMEMYLAQMIIFRLVEKCHLLYIFGTGWISYVSALVLTVLGLVIFIEGYKFLTRSMERCWANRKRHYIGE